MRFVRIRPQYEHPQTYNHQYDEDDMPEECDAQRAAPKGQRKDVL
jgi:hypothetical protein